MITFQDWDNVTVMSRVLGPFNDATGPSRETTSVCRLLDYERVGFPHGGVDCCLRLRQFICQRQPRSWSSITVTAGTTFPMSRSPPPLVHVPKPSCGLTRLKGLCGAALFLWRLRECSKRISTRRCGQGASPTEFEVRRNTVWTGERHQGRSRRRMDL